MRQGEPRRLLRTLFAALQKAQWCSSDPICIETSGQGTDNANLAACHGCLLISETSCEEGNRLLDRAMLVGSQINLRLDFSPPCCSDAGDVANLGQRAISIVPTFVPSQLTDGHICGQPSTWLDHG